ncbi:hypothetical protein LAZ67_15002460 [Cordylochernes scorpioides]|uniref:Reverse transcriptase domain-containing protein n=1 Tax=Cordylochernes scorpioides TaxID=51811 RepID=A0ABY6LAS7_9ARAC|nr:hypothetical protein LAZ67_15002460 [Cordylochernes scorpioides]
MRDSILGRNGRNPTALIIMSWIFPVGLDDQAITEMYATKVDIEADNGIYNTGLGSLKLITKKDEISLTTCGLVDPPFSENEVKLTAFKFEKRKSPGPEGIDNTVVKALLRMHPSLLARFFNRCLDTGTFLEAWKVARVVLLEKSGRKGNSPNDYRPLSLLVCLGMVLDSLLAQRLKHWLESNELLSSFLRGFREGNSTTTALNEEELPEGAWLVLYADDQFLIIEAASRAKADKCVEASLQILSNWAHDSGLKFNVSKTKALSFKPRDIRTKRKGIKWEHKPAIRMKGRRVALVNRMTILGVVIDDKMGWQYQAEEMVTRGREARFVLVLAGLIPLGLKLEEETIRQKIWENRKPPQWLPKWNWSPGGPTGIDTEVFTDGSKSGANTGAGVVIFTNGELIFQESLTLRVDELVFSAELVAIRVALRVCAEKNFSPDRLYSDCISALVAINLVKGQLAHQIIQELEMITRAPEGEGTASSKEERRRARGAIESKLLRNHSKLLEKAHDVASELFLNSMAAALQKFDIDPEQQLYTPKIVDIAAAVMEMHGYI